MSENLDTILRIVQQLERGRHGLEASKQQLVRLQQRVGEFTAMAEQLQTQIEAREADLERDFVRLGDEMSRRAGPVAGGG